MFFTNAILLTLFFLFIHLSNSSGLIHKEILHPKIVIENNQIVYAKFIDAEVIDEKDTSSNVTNNKEKSDWFYYALGIMILIAAGFILKQRYEQYLKQRENL